MNASPAPSSSLLPAVILMLVCTAVWGSVFPIAKPVLDEMHPYSLAFWRFAVASVCLLPYLFFMKRSGYPPLTPVGIHAEQTGQTDGECSGNHGQQGKGHNRHPAADPGILVCSRR